MAAASDTLLVCHERRGAAISVVDILKDTPVERFGAPDEDGSADLE